MNVVGTLILITCVFVGLVLLPFKRTRVVGLSLVGFSFACIGFFIHQSSVRNAAFENVTIGQSEAEIIAAIGKPLRITDGTEWVEEGVKRNASELIPNCTKEYWYNSFLFPEALSLCFNTNGKLIYKYRYVSW
ncbi:MAG: hypothetical protein K0S63_792 [Gammaproteobacteria bacterium]|jgi:hypothetical protein|nr:hypothetical protein [Gammaproteobacteria bacterium]